MLREYALVILDQKDTIVDRFNIDIATASTGNGFQLELSTISSELEDIITQVNQKKLIVTFTIQQIHNSYAKADLTAQWIQKYSRPEYTMALEWRFGTTLRYCVGKVTSLTKNDRQNPAVLSQQLQFTQTTPWFIHKENVLLYEESSIGKKYNYSYPYSYGANRVVNNEIENVYLYEIPLTITIDGAITNPIISLTEFDYEKDENGNNIIDRKIIGETYSYIEFEDLDVKNTHQLVIDSGKRKITLYKYEDITKKKLIGQEDVTNKVKDSSDTFLRARAGFSQINYNRETVDSNFKITGSWRQYTL